MVLVGPVLQWLHLLQPHTFFLLSVFTLFFLIRLNRSWSEKPNLPPSPPKLPIIGNLHQLGPLVHRSFRGLSDKYGPLMLVHTGYVPTLVVSSAEMATEILKTHEMAFANRFSTTAIKLLMYDCNDIAFSPYGDYWKKARKICVTELLSIQKVQSFKSVREEEVNIMIQEISQSCLKGSPINLSDMIIALSNSIISKCALGTKHEGTDGKNEFGELSREFLKLLETFSFGSVFPWLGWLDILTGSVRRIKKVSAQLDTYFDQIIDEHLTPSRLDDNSDYGKDFVDILLHVHKNDKNFTRNNIKAIILDMFLGGSDTTSTTIEWAFAELIKHPNVMKKAQEEVRRVVRKKCQVDEEDIKQMDYLKSVIKEALRLHSPAAFIPRASSTSTNVKGYNVPPNTKVFINVWAIQRDSKVWDRPEEFIPERFINNTTDYKGQHYKFIPFGVGRRMCPGMSFGVAVIELILANLLYRYDWKLPGDAHQEELDMTEEFGLTVNKKIPLHLIPVLHFS